MANLYRVVITDDRIHETDFNTLLYLPQLRTFHGATRRDPSQPWDSARNATHSATGGQKEFGRISTTTPASTFQQEELGNLPIFKQKQFGNNYDGNSASNSIISR